MGTALFGHHDPGPACLCWHVLELGQAIFYRHDVGFIVHVDLRRERPPLHPQRVDINQASGRDLGRQQRSAIRTMLAMGRAGLGIIRDLIRAFGELHLRYGPKSEGCDRGRGPGPAILAMAVALGHRGACHLDFNGSAKTRSFKTFSHLLPFLGMEKVDRTTTTREETVGLMVTLGAVARKGCARSLPTLSTGARTPPNPIRDKTT